MSVDYYGIISLNVQITRQVHISLLLKKRKTINRASDRRVIYISSITFDVTLTFTGDLDWNVRTMLKSPHPVPSKLKYLHMYVNLINSDFKHDKRCLFERPYRKLNLIRCGKAQWIRCSSTFELRENVTWSNCGFESITLINKVWALLTIRIWYNPSSSSSSWFLIKAWFYFQFSL